MLKLSFKQTRAEFMVRIASSLIFNKLVEANFPVVAIRDVTENVQYGYTEKAAKEEIGPKYVRITDIQDGQINWETVPYCTCEQPEQYLLSMNDLLFARTGATTGKTHLVRENPPNAVFASYLIRVRPQKSINPEYLYSFFQSDLYWSQVSDQKEGSAQPNVNGQKLSNIQIPVVDKQIQSAINEFLSIVRLRQDGIDRELPKLPPPLTEQRRIVTRIEALAGRVAAAQSLRREASDECELLLRSMLFDTSHGEPKLTPMRELVTLRTPDVTVASAENYHFAGVYSFGRGVFRGINRSGNQFAYPKLTRLRTNDFTYPKLMAWEGAYGIVPPECDGLVVSTEFPVFELNQEKILPEVMDVYFRNPTIWETLSGQSTGTNVRRRRLNPQTFLSYKFPLPPMKQQLLLREVYMKVSALRAAQAESEKELAALMPSVLDRAFKSGIF